MPVSTTSNRVQYNCDGSQTEFAFTFPIFETSDLVVTIADADGTETTLTETTDYSVAPSGNDYSGGGTVTTVATYSSDYTITIVRTVTLDQETDFQTLDVLPAETLEDALDKLTMITQQIKEQTDRTLKLQVTSAYSDLDIPDPEADKYLAWKSALDGLKNMTVQSQGDLSVSSFIETLLDDADATAARATIGAEPSLPIGTIIMYDGAGIDTPDTRTEAIGDRAGDTITMPGWYVMNGQSGTPDLRNKFIRSENASGNTGGEDTHTLITSEIPSHQHTEKSVKQVQVQTSDPGNDLITIPDGGGWSAGVRNAGNTGAFYGNKFNKETVNSGSTGDGAAHENKPAYYSLIFIKKMS